MIATVAERVRSLVPVDKKLADAVAEIRRRKARRDEIEAGFRKRASVECFIEKVHQAEAAYASTQSDDDLERVLNAELILEKATQRAAISNAQINYGIIDNQFRGEFPDNRSLLVKACSLKLQAVKVESARAVVVEEERLSIEGFDQLDIARSPIIRKAKDDVERFSSLLESLKTRPVEEVWRASDVLFLQ